MASIISATLGFAIETLLEIDEMYHEKLPDGRLKVVFVTTGVHPDVAKIKTWLWAVFGLPIQKVDEVTVEEEQRGPILKRYKITVVLSPFIVGALRDYSIGLREALEGRVIK